MEQRTSDVQIQVHGNGHPAPDRDSGLPCRGHLKKVLDCQTVRTVPPEHVLFSQGESPHTLCLICSGLVKLTRTESDGARFIIGVREKGWMLGAVSTFLKMQYEVTAETITQSRLCFVPAELFMQLMDTNLEFSRFISVMLSGALRGSLASISDQACLSGRERLEKFLWRLVQAKNGSDLQKSVKIHMVLKNWEVAQLLAITPQHLCRLVKQMEKEGILKRKKGWLILPEPARLVNPKVGSHDFS